ncbi:putative RNA-directed DNA polymerase [Tanacetum coccineum]
MGASSSSGYTNFDTPFTKDQMMKILSLINEKPTGNTSANMAGMRPTFYNGNAMFNLHFKKLFSTQTCSYMYNLSVGWIIDSRANQHFIVSTKNMFNVTDISGLNLTVGHPNGTLAKISAIGNLRLTSNVVMFDVLVILEYNDLNLVKTVGTGSEAAGLYLFDEDQSGKPTLGLSNSSFVCHTSKQLWHSRHGHPTDQVLSILSKSIGFKYDKHVSPCDICHKAKQTRDPFPLSDHKFVALGDLVHLDLWGPYKVVSRDEYRYFLTIVDDYSRAVWVYLIKTKDEVCFYIESFVEMILTQFNKKIKVFRSDNGTEFVNNKLAVFFKEKGIIHETSCAHTPQQNGIVERKHRHLLNVAIGLMFQGGIPLNMWFECTLTAVYLINRLPSSVLSGSSPYLLVYGKEPNLSLILDVLAVCVILLHTSEIPFDDEREQSKDDGNVMAPNNINSSQTVDEDATFATSLTKNTNISEGQHGTDASIPRIISDGLNSSNSGDEPQTVRKSDRVRSLPSKFNDYVMPGNKKYGIEKHVNYSKLSPVNMCFASNLNKSSEPKSLQEGMLDKNWIEAMNNEMEALFRNKTWVLVDLPPNRKTIGCKWLWKIKYKSSGEIERYKARLVAKGFSQRNGIDYEETFSPVVKMVTVRCIISLVVHYNWPLFQLDVNNAFLYGDLHEDVYMDLPPGYYDPSETRVCKLVKSLYGLKQASRQWNEKLTSVLNEHGFVHSMNDYSLFVKHDSNNILILLVYVDDIVITGSNLDEINKFKRFLASKFQIKDLGSLKYFLGIEVLENKNGICLSQRKYYMELLSEYGLLACKPVATPMQQNVSLSHIETEKDKKLKNLTAYQKLIGKLIYLSVTRPDISYAVHYLSQHMHSPSQSHFSVGLRVLKYLKQSPRDGIQFYNGNKMSLHAYSDADWAKCLISRKFVSGFCVHFCGNLVSWKSKKQTTISRSSAEAKYRCLASTTCEVLWLTHLLSDVGVEGLLPVTLYCDSTSAIQIAANPVFHEKTKHFEIDVHLVRDKVSSGAISTVKINSTENIADVFTKGLSITQHKQFCLRLNLVDMFQWLNVASQLSSCLYKLRDG